MRFIDQRAVQMGALVTTMVALTSFALAADSKKDTKTAAAPPVVAAAPASDKDAKAQSAWVKVCEKATFKTYGKEDKKDVCLTHHERLDANTGMVLVSAAIRTIEGQPAPALVVMLPAGLALIPGIQVKIDDDKDVLKFPFTLCTAAGCTGEIEAKPEFIAKLRAGKELTVAAMNIAGTALGFPVPLNGIGPALDGAPLDSAKYTEARKGLMDIIKKRQADASAAAPKN
jgi:invasion protein IalB